MKTCVRCLVPRNLAAFGKNRSRRDGLASACLECMRLYDKRDRGPCVAPFCERKAYCKNLCVGHYKRLNKGQDISTPVRAPTPGEWGVWFVDSRGYVSRTRLVSAGRQVNQQQHRVIMEEVLGRNLLPGENVHHINGVKHDNRPENLELWSTSQPSGQRTRDKVEWALQLLRTYRPELLKESNVTD